MTAILSIATFGGACAAASYAIAATVVPNVSRIIDALAGRSDAGFSPLATLVQAERRLAVKRWATAPRSPVPTLRAAA